MLLMATRCILPNGTGQNNMLFRVVHAAEGAYTEIINS